MNGFNDYQFQASDTAIYPEDQALEYLTMGLCSEAGEVASAFKKIIRDNECGLDEISMDDRVHLAHELGDVLWYVAMLAYELDFNLDHVAEWNLQKLKARQERNKLKGSGDNR